MKATITKGPANSELSKVTFPENTNAYVGCSHTVGSNCYQYSYALLADSDDLCELIWVCV